MGDSRPPEEVEERAGQLCALIDQHAHFIAPPEKETTLGELGEWFTAEMQRLDALPIDDEVKDEHRGKIHERYAELTDQLLENMHP
jgi:hypothetical protein